MGTAAMMKMQKRELSHNGGCSYVPVCTCLLDLRIVDVISLCIRLVCCSISVTFVSEKDGSETTVQAPIGQHLLEVAHKNDIELEGVSQQLSSVRAPCT
jgi:hypothetical protein